MTHCVIHYTTLFENQKAEVKSQKRERRFNREEREAHEEIL